MRKIIRATLDHGDGGVLLEGEDLPRATIEAAVAERFPDEKERHRQLRRVVVEFATGERIRPWRFLGYRPRVVGDTIYL